MRLRGRAVRRRGRRERKERKGRKARERWMQRTVRMGN